MAGRRLRQRLPARRLFGPSGGRKGANKPAAAGNAAAVADAGTPVDSGRDAAVPSRPVSEYTPTVITMSCSSAMITGTTRPTTGTVRVSGPVAAILELGAGFHPEFTGRENVFLNGEILGISRREMEASVAAIFRATCPDLPMPEHTTRPRQARIARQALALVTDRACVSR